MTFAFFKASVLHFWKGYCWRLLETRNKQVKTNIKQTILFTPVNVSVAHVPAVLEEA